MTKQPSMPKIEHETSWTITTLKKLQPEEMFSLILRENQLQYIPVRTLKQLNIIPKEKKVCSTLQFEAFPNEVICRVFSYLKILDLLNCGLVSKRLRAISIDDQHLWPKKLNLCNKKVPVGFLQRLLDSGCKYLSLSEAILDVALSLPKASRQKYLDLFGFGTFEYMRENSEILLESCYSLQKLSLSKAIL